MNYFTRLANLMIEVMLPLSLLVTVGGLWPRFFSDTPVEGARTLLNRMVMYLFLPSILFSVASTTPISGELLSVPLLVGVGSLLSGLILHVTMYRTSVVEGTTPAMMTTLLLAERFRLDSRAAALLIGWTTILFWLTLPAIMALGLIR